MSVSLPKDETRVYSFFADFLRRACQRSNRYTGIKLIRNPYIVMIIGFFNASMISAQMFCVTWDSFLLLFCTFCDYKQTSRNTNTKDDKKEIATCPRALYYSSNHERSKADFAQIIKIWGKKRRSNHPGYPWIIYWYHTSQTLQVDYNFEIATKTG